MAAPGWSAGDVITGLKVLWDVWQAVSDGPLNARYEASQFFDEFHHVVSRLGDWEQRRAASVHDDRLLRSHRQLREDCTRFIKDHFSLMQQINPKTKASRPGRSTWIQKVAFTRDQVVELYHKVDWPNQRAEVTKLREKLLFFLNIAAWDIALDTNNVVRDIRTTNKELVATNYKLVTSHLDLVASITTNLKRVTNPFEPGRQAQEIDYPMLRQFERALRPPQPIAGLLEENHRQADVPWMTRRGNDEAQYSMIEAANPQHQDSGAFGQEEVRGLISQRLDNLAMRVTRTEPMQTISEASSQEGMPPSTQQLLVRLKEIRAQIGDAVGILHHVPQEDMPLTEPRTALQKELEEWDTMKERIEREILHPSALRRVWTVDSTTAETIEPTPSRELSGSTSTAAHPMEIARRVSPPTGSLSPPLAYDGWGPPPGRRSPASLSSSPKDGRLSTSPKDRRFSSGSGSNSNSSTSRRQSIRSDHEFHIHLYYPGHAVQAVVRSISRNDEGDVLSITSYSPNGSTRYYHAVDYDNEDLKIETSMIPFVDNTHVVEGQANTTPRYRVHFKGIHSLKIFARPEYRGDAPIAAHPSPPIYKFLSDTDSKEFQKLLLNKDVKHHTDVFTIKNHASDVLCRISSIRILYEPFSRTRHILYFQHLHLQSDQKAGFVEWPVSVFKKPKEPNKRSKTLTLETSDSKPVSPPKPFSLARRGTVMTMASTESAGPAFLRMEERTASFGARSIRGLVLDFYDAAACHKFWEEFTKQDPQPQQPSTPSEILGLNIESGFSVPMPRGSG